MKMTLENLKSFVVTYVTKTLQANPTYTPSYEDITGLLNKIGKQIEIKGLFNDPLTELDAEFLALGKTIEEYFTALILPQDFDANGADDKAPAYPPKGAPYYSYTLGRKKIKTTVPYGQIEGVAITPEFVANYIASIMENLYNSQDMYKFNIKKQLLANVIDKAVTKKRTTVIAKPVDTVTAEEFIVKIKDLITNSKFPNQGNALSDELIGATPRLTLYLTKGVKSVLDVKALSGAFNMEKLALECDIKEIDDFGNADAKYYGLLVDTRGVKLHPSYLAVRQSPNGEGDFINHILHSEYTAFISNYVFVNVIASAA